MSVNITQKSAVRHRPIGDGSNHTVPVVLRRSRTTATTQRQTSARQEEPYDAEVVYGDVEGVEEETDAVEEVETGQLGRDIGRRSTRRITEEPITRSRSTPTRSVALRRSPVTTAPSHGYVHLGSLIFWVIGTGLLLLCLNFGLVLARNVANTQYLAATTGTTPTAQLDATLHGQQMHFIVILLHQHLQIIALDETDAKQTHLYPDTNPLLTDQGPVTLGVELRDVNGDGKPDLVISATSPTVNFFWQPSVITVILLNSDGFHFKPM